MSERAEQAAAVAAAAERRRRYFASQCNYPMLPSDTSECARRTIDTERLADYAVSHLAAPAIPADVLSAAEHWSKGGQAHCDAHRMARFILKELSQPALAAPVGAEGRERQLETALRRAERFISNGIEYGYIRMPDADTPDSAHETLPMIRAALASQPTVPPPAMGDKARHDEYLLDCRRDIAGGVEDSLLIERLCEVQCYLRHGDLAALVASMKGEATP